MRTRTKLYIQSTTNKEINLVLRFFGQSGASAVRADMKISAILLKYATFEGVFFIFSWAKKLAQLYHKKLIFLP